MRYLLINADDFGMGPPTSQGILDLAQRGVVTSSVLLVNSPFAEDGVRAWRAAGATLEMGWHPTLTLDKPILPAAQVPSLVDPVTGGFFPLGPFLKRHLRGRISPDEIRAEFTAQYHRCCDLLGSPPNVVNTHHHIQIFRPIGTIIKSILRDQKPVPYMRLVREPWPMLLKIPGARVKRFVLNWFGRRAGRRQRFAGLMGNDWLIGVTDPKFVHDPDFFVRQIRRVPGHVVELTCHPGHFDESLIGRDCTRDDGMCQRRVQELKLLSEPRFLDACKNAGFQIITPSQLRHLHYGEKQHAA